MAGLEVHLELNQFCCPLCDVARGVGVVQDRSQRVRGHYDNSVCLKIVAQFSGRNKYRIDKLMLLKLPGLRLVEDFDDVVDWLLDGPDPSERVRFALIFHVRSLGPQRSWAPTNTRLLRTP